MKKTVIFAFLLLASMITSASAQVDEEVRKYLVDTLDITGQVQAMPVGVDEMKYIGNKYIDYNDSLTMNYITRVIQYDVDFQADFELIPIDSFFVKTYEIKELDLLAWQRLGANYVLKLEAEFPSNKIRVRWKLYDAVLQQKMSNGVITHPKKDWRTMGHELANNVVRVLTGDPGIFLTKICYVKKIGDAKEIFMADFDGANETKLTDSKTINLSPAFSPNMKEIYFTSYFEGEPKLFKVNVKSKKMSKVADYTGIAAAPSISPDGNKIACVLSKDGNSEIYVLNMKGEIIKRLTRHRAIDSAPTWSPDGRMISFSSDRSGSPQVYLMDSDGLNVRRLTYQSRYNDSPIWSARGDRITFVSRTKYGRFDLASIDTSGVDFRVLTEVGMNENPHFAPDGKHIIFASTRLSSGDIFTMDINGRNQRRLTRNGNCSNPNWGFLK